MGVAENGAVWLPESRLGIRAALFLATHVVVVLDCAAIVAANSPPEMPSASKPAGIVLFSLFNSFIFQEVLQGAASEGQYRILRQYLETQRFYPLTDQVESYARAARIYMDCRKKGITVRSTIDCLVAETALEHNLALLHQDADFNSMAKVIPLKIY